MLCRSAWVRNRGIFRGLRNLTGANREAQRWTMAALASVIGFVLVNFTVSMFAMFPLGMVFWMCMAVALRTPESAAAPPEPAP